VKFVIVGKSTIGGFISTRGRHMPQSEQVTKALPSAIVSMSVMSPT